MITVPNAFTSLGIFVSIFQLFLHATYKDNLNFNFEFVNFNSTYFYAYFISVAKSEIGPLSYLLTLHTFFMIET